MRTPHPKNLEFGKLAQLLGSSYDQLGALGRKRSVKRGAAKKWGVREKRKWEQPEGWCSYCLVSERGQDDHPFHGVHDHPPELLQDALQNCLLTHSGKEREATDSGNR